MYFNNFSFIPLMNCVFVVIVYIPQKNIVCHIYQISDASVLPDTSESVKCVMYKATLPSCGEFFKKVNLFCINMHWTAVLKFIRATFHC